MGAELVLFSVGVSPHSEPQQHVDTPIEGARPQRCNTCRSVEFILNHLATSIVPITLTANFRSGLSFHFQIVRSGPLESLPSITSSRGSPQKRKNLTHLKFESRSRTRRFPICLIRHTKTRNQLGHTSFGDDLCLVSFLGHLFNHQNQSIGDGHTWETFLTMVRPVS